MARIQVNLAEKPFVNRVVPLILFFVLTGAALIFTLVNFAMFSYTGGGYRRLRTSVAEQEVAIQDVTLRIGEKQAVIQAATDRIFTEEARFVDELLLEKGFSWTLFLTRFEEVKAYGTMLQRIVPKIDKDGRVMVSVQGQANPRTEMLKLEQNLFESRYFRNAQIETEAKDPQNPWIEFKINFEYVPHPPELPEAMGHEMAVFGEVMEEDLEDRIGPPLPPAQPVAEIETAAPEGRPVPVPAGDESGPAEPRKGIFPW
jgi:hypothetical protein